jgi:phage regulator Rha-like protein
MNLILTGNEELTMSSREIAELTEKRHGDVMRDIRKMYVDLDIEQNANLRFDNKGANGKNVDFYQLDEHLTMTLVSGYNVKLRSNIIKRWQELEEKEKPSTPQIPQTFVQALELAVSQAKQLEEQAPKIAVYEQLADRKGDVSTTLLAKQLGTTGIQLNKFLRENDMKWQKADLPKAGYQDYFNVVAGCENDHEYTQCLITPLGQIEITKCWGEK